MKQWQEALWIFAGIAFFVLIMIEAVRFNQQ